MVEEDGGGGMWWGSHQSHVKDGFLLSLPFMCKWNRSISKLNSFISIPPALMRLNHCAIIFQVYDSERRCEY